MNTFNDAMLAVEDGDEITVTIIPWHETAPKAGGFSIAACSYCVILMVNGQIVRQLWGAGYAPEPIPVIAYALARVLAMVPESSSILVEALANFGLYWGPTGFVANRQSGQTLAPKKLSLWPLMQDLQAAHRNGRWRFSPLPKKLLAYVSFKANETARGLAKQKALEHKAEFSPTPRTYPRGIAMLQGGTV